MSDSMLDGLRIESDFMEITRRKQCSPNPNKLLYPSKDSQRSPNMSQHSSCRRRYSFNWRVSQRRHSVSVSEDGTSKSSIFCSMFDGRTVKISLGFGIPFFLIQFGETSWNIQISIRKKKNMLVVGCFKMFQTCWIISLGWWFWIV